MDTVPCIKHSLNKPIIIILFYENLVFREIAFLRHVNRETAFFFVVKRDPYPLFPTLNIAVLSTEAFKFTVLT